MSIVRIAMFRDIKYGGEFPFAADRDDWTIDGYIRVSEWQSIEFSPLPIAQAANAEISMLQAAREKVADEFGKKLAYLDGRISNLRAITHQVPA